MADLADALGWYSIPVPDLAVGAAAELVARLPFVPGEAQWIESVRRPVIMDTTRARTMLGWQPRHDARETLEEMVRAARSAGLSRGSPRRAPQPLRVAVEVGQPHATAASC